MSVIAATIEGVYDLDYESTLRDKSHPGRLLAMVTSLPRQRRILYAADLGPGTTSALRYEALRRLGQQVQPFDLLRYVPRSKVSQWLYFRYPAKPFIVRVNRDLVRAVESFQPDVVWLDKPLVFTPETMRAIQRAGARSVFYVQDSPFGPRKDGCWRQFLKVYRMADLHCLFRHADVERYKAWGLPFVETMFSFEPSMHFPPPPGFTEDQRTRSVSYIGHPHEQRPAFLLNLAREQGLPVFINGNRWKSALAANKTAALKLGPYLADERYRAAIWTSKINLSFVTEDNEDDIAHKAVEIAACGGFLLALRTPGHQAIFEEDREAVFFSSVEECADKCRYYLNRPDLREAIAARARERAVRGGYDNDTQLSRILNRLDGRAD